MKKLRRIFAFALACTMLLQMVPVYADNYSYNSEGNEIYTNSFDSPNDLNAFSTWYAEDVRGQRGQGFRNIDEEISYGHVDYPWIVESGYVTRNSTAPLWHANDEYCSAIANKEGWPDVECSGTHKVYEHWGVGRKEEGMVVEMLYDAREYVDFELTVDMTSAHDVGRQSGIGFGRTPGNFFIDSKWNMDSQGGAYITIDKEGNTSNAYGNIALWGYASRTCADLETVSAPSWMPDEYEGKEEAWENLGEAEKQTIITTAKHEALYLKSAELDGGDTVDKPNDEVMWYTLKVRVEGGKVTAKIKAQDEANTEYRKVIEAELKDYTGGYISLMTSATTSFDNLRIEALDEQDDEIDTPQVGQYNYFTPYYAADIRKGFVKSSFENEWEMSGDGIVVRKTEGDTNTFWRTNDTLCNTVSNKTGWGDCPTGEEETHKVHEHWQVGAVNEGMVAELLYNEKYYRNFEMTVDVLQPYGSEARQCGIGFGKMAGASFVNSSGKMQAIGGTYVTINKGGDVALWGYTEATVDSETYEMENSGYIYSSEKIDANSSGESNKWYTLKIRVENGKVSVGIKETDSESDFTVAFSDISLKDYNGGKISFVTSGASGFKNLSIQSIVYNKAESIGFNSLTPYYADDAKNGLVQEELSANWESATDTDGNSYIQRICPEGKQFWYSNFNDACNVEGCTETHETWQHYGVGRGIEGLVAELVYENKTYYNFELTVDVKNVSATSRQLGIGFGRTPGKFFMDSNYKMDSEGGAYATFARDGATALWGYAEGTMDDNNFWKGSVSGTQISTQSGEWRTIKLRVINGKVTMYVKNRGAADSTYQTALNQLALKDYTGGYISLMTSSDAGFANLKVKDLGSVITVQSYLVGADTPVDSIVDLTGGGAYYSGGEEITLTAPAKDSYRFLGWFTKQQVDAADWSYPQCSALVYNYTVQGDADLCAVYSLNNTNQENDGGKVTVKINGVRVKCNVLIGRDSILCYPDQQKPDEKSTLNDYASQDENGNWVIEKEVNIGTKVTLFTDYDYKANDNFLYWANETEKIVSTAKKYTFIITGNTELNMYCKRDDTVDDDKTKAYVEFRSAHSQVLKADMYAESEIDSFEFPTAPSKKGYTFTGWSIGGGTAKSAEEIRAAIKAAIKDGEPIVVVPVYELKSETEYKITVHYVGNNGDPVADDKVLSGYQFGDVTSVMAAEISGHTFSCWSKTADGNNVLGYNRSYWVAIGEEDVDIYAIYGEAVKPEPVVVISDIYQNVSGANKISFETTRSVPAGYTVIEAGLLYGVKNITDLDYGAAGVKRLVSSSTSKEGIFIGNIKVGTSTSTVVYAKGYVIVREESTGNLLTYYSECIGKSFEALGAETTQ